MNFPDPPSPYEEFEKTISRAMKILEGQGAAVSWNKKIADPSAPDRSRQIDVLIERDGILTIVECRSHRKPQDVKWIEELIGRRLSLGVTNVVGAATGGFTELAKKKARDHGVSLIQLSSVSGLDVFVENNRFEPFFQYIEVQDFQLHFHTQHHFRYSNAERFIHSIWRTGGMLEITNSIAAAFDRVPLFEVRAFHSYMDTKSIVPCMAMHDFEMIRISGRARRVEISHKPTSLFSIVERAQSVQIDGLDYFDLPHQILVLGDKVHHHINFSKLQLPAGAILTAFGLRCDFSVECTGLEGNVRKHFLGPRSSTINLYVEDKEGINFRRLFARHHDERFEI